MDNLLTYYVDESGNKIIDDNVRVITTECDDVKPYDFSQIHEPSLISPDLINFCCLKHKNHYKISWNESIRKYILSSK